MRIPTITFGGSIKTQLTVLLFALTASPIVVVGYLGMRGMLDSGAESQRITSQSAQTRAEQFLVQTTADTAAKNSLIFTNIQHQTRHAAEYVEGLLQNPTQFPNSYWRYNSKIIRLSGGQYTNSGDELSSIYISNKMALTSQLKKGIEVTSYMDFYAPQMLKDQPDLAAVYYMGTQGETRYYPNIKLADFTPADYDPSAADYFSVAIPKNDPDKTTKTTDVYDDPAGNGLLLTIAHPIYINNDANFMGVMSIDVTLSGIAKNIKDYSPIESSYAVLIDNKGKAVALPEQGYKDILGRSSKSGEFGSSLKDVKNEFGPVLKEMMSGKTGFKQITANNNQLYVSYAQVAGTNFNLAIIAQKNSLLKVVGELQSQLGSATYQVLFFQILPVGLGILLLFWLLSIIYIRAVTKPLSELTAETRKIMQDGFKPSNIQVNATTEVNTLAEAFNKMTAELAASYKVLQRQVRQLADGKAKDDAMLDSIGEGVIVADVEGKILLINAAASQLLGIDATQMVNKPFTAIPLYEISGKLMEVEQRPLSAVIKTGKKVEHEVLVTAGNGIKRYLKVIASPVMQEGNIVGAIEIVRDVTKEKEVDRMKTDFISIASHQLRTPLSAIRWFSEMLLAGDLGKLKDSQQEFVGNISQSTKRLIDLVGSLLNISRLEAGRVTVDPKPTDLKKLIEGVVTDLKTDLADRRQKIEIYVDEAMPQINVDARLVSQVYMNLLTNAIKYTPNSGQIYVRVVLKGKEVVSEVKDSGYGIPRVEQAKIFQRFFRASNIVKVETDGTGLGLYLIRVIVESSGGRVWFESEEGKGTTFWFTLPLKGMEPKRGDTALE
jgi:PAS domain S-box-containing protein